jgi:hypothetical protein
MRIIYVIVLLIATLLGGCSKSVSKDSLVGKYVLRLNNGTDIIELYSSGEYLHRYFANDGHTAEQHGVWGLETLEAGPTVVINNFKPLTGDKPQGNEIYLLLVRQSFGRFYLITNIDLNEGYERSP